MFSNVQTLPITSIPIAPIITMTAKEKLLQERLKSLERKIAEYELELKEAKEIAEFSALERDVYVESLREAENSLAKDRTLWAKQKCDYEQMLDALNAKYHRNHKIWRDNDLKATQEIKALDDIVDHVIRTIESLPYNIRHFPAIERMHALVKGNTSLSAVGVASSGGSVGAVSNGNDNTNNNS